MKEKRRLERFDLEIAATIQLLTSDPEENPLDLLASNICSGGVYFHTNQLLPEGAQAKVDLVLPLDKLKN